MTNTIPTDITVLKQLIALRLDVNIWSARKKLTPADFGTLDLPPEKLASLGSKKVCNPEDLRVFATLKHGITLPLNHSFWSTWWPINAWGCHCQVDILSRRAAEAAGWTVSDDPPPDEMVTHQINGRQVLVPKGIDPGFDYNPGEAAFGHRLNDQVMDQWRAAKRDAWEVTNPGDWQSAGRPAMVPVDKARAVLGPKAADVQEVTRIVEKVIGGKERIFTLPDGSRVLVDAASLGGHIDPARASWLPFLPELLEDPFEVWLAFERHKGTGKVELRKRLIKVVETDKGALTLSAQANKGRLEAWTFIPSDKPKQLERSRVGKLLYGRK